MYNFAQFCWKICVIQKLAAIWKYSATKICMKKFITFTGKMQFSVLKFPFVGV